MLYYSKVCESNRVKGLLGMRRKKRRIGWRMNDERSHMKKTLKGLVNWMTILGNLCVFIGCFITFAKGYSWYYGEVDSVALFRVFEYDDYDMMKVALVVMWIAAIVSLFALSSFKESTGMPASITLVVVAFVGRYCYGYAKNEMISLMNEDFYSVESGIGATILEKAYIVLIVAAFLVLGICVYNQYIEKNLKGKLQSMIVPMGASCCPKCGKNISAGSKFCAACGFSLESLNCPKCGARRELEAQFCKACGERLPVLRIKEMNKSLSTGWNVQKDEGAKEESKKYWVCGKCGEENSINSRHCEKCGGGK